MSLKHKLVNISMFFLSQFPENWSLWGAWLVFALASNSTDTIIEQLLKV